MKKYSEYIQYLKNNNIIKLEDKIMDKEWYDSKYLSEHEKLYTIIITLEGACGLRADYNSKKSIITPWVTNDFEKEKNKYIPKEFECLIDDR